MPTKFAIGDTVLVARIILEYEPGGNDLQAQQRWAEEMASMLVPCLGMTGTVNWVYATGPQCYSVTLGESPHHTVVDFWETELEHIGGSAAE